MTLEVLASMMEQLEFGNWEMTAEINEWNDNLEIIN